MPDNLNITFSITNIILSISLHLGGLLILAARTDKEAYGLQTPIGHLEPPGKS